VTRRTVRVSPEPVFASQQLAWEDIPVTSWLKMIGKLTHVGILDDVGTLGIKLRRAGVQMSHRLSSHIAKLPGAPVDALMDIGSSLETAARYMASPGIIYPPEPNLLLENFNSVAQDLTSAVSNVSAGAPTLRDVTKLAWIADGAKCCVEYLVEQIPKYAAFPDLIALEMIAPALINFGVIKDEGGRGLSGQRR
jgi:hypothetical protein